MPYAGLTDQESQDLDGCVEKVMAKGHQKPSAIAICRSSMNMSADADPFVTYAFEPFGSLEGVLRGEPIRIMPLGTFYRDDRKLEITEADLRAIEKNVSAGLPRFRIPINENHSGVGKVGSVERVRYLADGPDGAGLYATDYHLTDEGRKLVQAKRFDSVSPEVIWKKNGGVTYQDPQTGKRHDNVLVGLALTDRPFFGHDNVALFSAFETFAQWDTAKINDLPDSAFLHIEAGGDKDEQGRTVPRALRHFPYKNSDGKIDLPHLRNALARIPQSSLPADVKARISAKATEIAQGEGVGEGAKEGMADQSVAQPKRRNGYTALKEMMARKFQELMALVVEDEQAQGEGDGKMSMPEIQRAEKAGMDLPAVAPAAARKGVDMADIQITAPPPAPEKFNVNAEEFKAVQEKAAKAEADLLAVKAQAEQFAVQLAETRRARRRDQLMARCETFNAISEKPEVLADKFLALEEKDPEAFKFFDALLETLNAQLRQSALFSQITSERALAGVETLDGFIGKLLKDRFNDDPAKYAEAFKIAGQLRPDLAAEYKANAPGR